MNENIYLTQILKDCPRGTRLYTPLAGKVYLVDIKDKNEYQITVEDKDFKELTFDYKGRCFTEFKDGECLLFPSKDQRDWSKFTAPWYKKDKFDPKTLKAFDRVLARIDGGDVYCWFADFVSTPTIEKYDLLPCIMSNKVANMIIPYNDDTKHLVGTTEEAPEYYRYWED